VILALDASTHRGSIAVLGEQSVREVFPETPRGRGGALFSALEEILHDDPEIRRVVVGVGPGSYNGIRSAIAAAWGIAIARDIPIVGISSLFGLADGNYGAVGDARREQYFFACIQQGAFRCEPKLLTQQELIVAVREIPDVPIFAASPIEFLPGVIIRTPSAARLALLAAGRAPNNPQPLYLKAAHITTPKVARP
jgi:tRNA threonylcarbamoyl adenosine modification protein YeaZ